MLLPDLEQRVRAMIGIILSNQQAHGRRSPAFFLQKYQWITFKTKDGLPYFMLSPYAYHKAMIFQPEATNNQNPEFVKCSDTRYTPSR